ncbi:MAG: hypothetical protein IPP06_12120 [Saprospiraceae bacterium]|nr:hypothetical protein [Candidatus Vicinibacter affinis]
MGLSIGSILTEIIPCAMVTDLLVYAASIGNTLFMTYKSLSELKTFLGTNNTLFRAIFETIDELNLIDALEWSKTSGALEGQFKLLLGGKSVDEILKFLSTKLNASWIPASGIPRQLEMSGIILRLYIDSSYGGPSIHINVDGLFFEIRLH